MKDHRLIDERSLAFHRKIAEKLRADPTLIGKAQATVRRWLKTCSPAVRRTLLEWLSILESPFEVILALLEATDERATRLRQSSPFCGILTEPERLAIIREFRARESAPLSKASMHESMKDRCSIVEFDTTYLATNGKNLSDCECRDVLS